MLVAGFVAFAPVLSLRVRVAAAAAGFARLAAGFFAAVERFAVVFFARVPVERLVALVARTALPPVDPPSSDHLPDSTR